MRRNSTLFVVLSLLLLLIAGGVAAMSFRPSGGALLATAGSQEPTADPLVPVVVAQIDLPKGTLIDAPDGLMSVDQVPVSQFNEQTQFNDPEALRDMVTTMDIKAGEPLGRSAVREAGLAQKIPEPTDGQPSLRAFPIQVNSLSGVADLVQAGDFVDVVGSFKVDVTTLYNNGQGVSEKTTPEGTTKVLLQDVEVLDVVKPALPAEGEAGSPPPEAQNDAAQPVDGTASNELTPGNWIIVLAVTNEEAEVLRFTLNHGINLTTVLRRAGDHTTDDTVGATMRILSETYGLPTPGLLTIEEFDSLPPASAPAPANP